MFRSAASRVKARNYPALSLELHHQMLSLGWRHRRSMAGSDLKRPAQPGRCVADHQSSYTPDGGTPAESGAICDHLDLVRADAKLDTVSPNVPAIDHHASRRL